MGDNMRNDDKRPSGTIFVDLDGTLVKHNYDPDGEPEELIYNTYARLLNYAGKGYDIILTTARSEEQIQSFKEQWPDVAKLITLCICNLGYGPRVLINDHVEGEPCKAEAINLVRNTGCTEKEVHRGK
jgi:hypothetical protein